jgi:hypothetical protein
MKTLEETFAEIRKIIYTPLSPRLLNKIESIEKRKGQWAAEKFCVRVQRLQRNKSN